MSRLFPTGNFKGRLEALGLPEIMEYLRVSRRTGLLTFKNGELEKALHFNEGNVVFAQSNAPEDRLGDILLQQGKITQAQYEESARRLSEGKRQGRILVEMKALTPKGLWSAIRDQITRIGWSLFDWSEGVFRFYDGVLPSSETITVEVPVAELILEGLRRTTRIEIFREKIPGDLVVFERCVPKDRPKGLNFEDYEKYVYKKVDGAASVGDIIAGSDVGESETLRILYIFFTLGFLKVKGQLRPLGPPPEERERLVGIINEYNEMYAFLYRYLLREVGPIADNLSRMYLDEVRRTHGDTLRQLQFDSEGRLDAQKLASQAQELPERIEGRLLESLNELLYALLLAVRKTLGADHEQRAMRVLKDIRGDAFAAATVAPPA